MALGTLLRGWRTGCVWSGAVRLRCTSAPDTPNLLIPDPVQRYMEQMARKFEIQQNQINQTGATVQFKRKFQRVQPIFERIQALQAESIELQALTQDPELREMAIKDLKTLAEDQKNALAELKLHLLDPPSYDENNASVEVVPGAGGLEACLFAQEIFDMYTNYMRDNLGFEVEVVEYERSSVGLHSKFSSTTGIQRAVATVQGRAVFRAMKYESGVHRVQRVPVTGTKNDRLQTSTCSVAVLPIPNDDDIVIHERDLKVDFTRSSGPGGQNVNKVDSACRIVHIPTGKVVECQEEKKGAQNKKKAILKLRKALFDERYGREMDALNRSRKSQIGNMNRNEKIRTYNYSRHMITDHRVGVSRTVPNLANFFLGNFGFEILEEFQAKLEDEAQEMAWQELLASEP